MKTAVLFGYGNYAKTNIIPNLPANVQLRLIHEIDPMQLGRVWGSGKVAYCTNAFPSETEWFDLAFVAGYHHTHARIAIEFLRRGAAVVCEKPIAVQRDDFMQLYDEVSRGGRFYACFHKRYSRWNRWIREDLGVSESEPLNYHAIVYEVKLPERHWYRWPNSRSRLVSNGCHWIDHFLFLNNYSEIRSRGVLVGDDSTLFVTISLVNGALFSMTLTDNGSGRVGVRELVEVTAREGRVRITDACKYVSEDGSSVVRTYRENPLSVYGEMYREIVRSAVSGHRGDQINSLRSTEVTLDLDELLSRMNSARAPG